MDKKILKELRIGDCIKASTYCDKPLYIDRITEYSVHCHTRNKTASYLVNYEEIDSVEMIKPHWKPSDEQMENLSRAFNGGTFQTSLLMELYQDLKKLREE